LDLSLSIRELDPDLSIDKYFESDLDDASFELDMSSLPQEIQDPFLSDSIAFFAHPQNLNT